MKRLLLLPFFISLLPYAFADDREDRFMQLKLRRAQQERNEADNTAIEFGAGEMQDGEDLALSLMKVVNAQNEEGTARLLDIYRRQDVYDPDIVLFAEANQAVFRDDLKAALAKYRELYRQNPEFLRGRLDLARLLFIDKQNKESAALFDGIDIPEVPAVNEKIKVFADALKKRDAWSGSVSFGAGYDTNLNQSSGTTVVRNQTSCGFDSNGQPILDDAEMLSCRNEQLDAYAPSLTGRAARPQIRPLPRRIKTFQRPADASVHHRHLRPAERLAGIRRLRLPAQKQPRKSGFLPSTRPARGCQQTF